ncbi:MAG: transglycosylase domain-containing protein [Bacteroidia bacterium]|nr:transglycosylase domain-containing protein [Bacteroidia bacterium]
MIWLVVLLPIACLFAFVLAISNNFLGDLPTFEELENPKSSLASEVISADGTVIGKYFIQNRSNVHFDELSPNLVKALLATEDIRFEKHSGIDLKGLFRVLFKTVLTRQDAGGGSTLTQQLAKNLFPREKMSKFQLVIRKIKEWIIAVRLERGYTKEEIMTMYLNTVEFGHNTYGIKSAARTFFQKTPDELNVEESAVLVGLLKGPTLFSPVRNPGNSTSRRNVVLGQMNKYGFLSDKELDSLKVLPIVLKYKPDDHNAGLATYFREVLRLELNKWCKEHKKADGTTYNIYRDGLRIYTTIDSRMQRYAEEAVKEHLTDLQKTFFEHWKNRNPFSEVPEVIEQGIKRSARYAELKEEGISEDSIRKIFNSKIRMSIFTWQGDKDTLMSPLDSVKYYKMILQTGMMSMEPQTGFVRAWVGGNNYEHFKYDHVKDGKRQVGSAFKPVVYTLAVQEGYSPCFKVPNAPVTIITEAGQSWTPKNSDNKYGGMLMLKEALAESVNTISAYLMKQFGPYATVEMAHKLGIQSPLEKVPSICLGTVDLSVFELTGAYSTFANKGVWTEPVYITRIEDKNGVVLQEFVPKKVEAINEETAYVMINMMQGAVQFGTSVRLRYKYGLTQPMAGKTGTTQNQSDGWYMGITPELVSGVWVGCEDRSVHFRSTQLGQGANMALPIWALYMKKLYADKELNIYQGDFEKPAGKISIELDCNKYKNVQQPGNDDFGF